MLTFIILVLFAALIALLSVCVGVETVRENTAALFEYTGRFAYCAMESAKRHFDVDGSIKDGSGLRSRGGCWAILRVVGWVFYIRPFVKPVEYSDHNIDDGFGKGKRVYLHEIVMAPSAMKAETKEPENVPLDVKFIMATRVVDPYKWVYAAPPDARTQVAAKMLPILRAWVRKGDENHAQAGKGNGRMIWGEITATGPDDPNGAIVIETIKKDWGLEIIENGITVADITPDAEHQAALQAARNSKLHANAAIEETAGRIRRSVAMELGLTPEELDQKLKDDPSFSGTQAYIQALRFAKDMVKRDRAANLMELRIGSTDGAPMPNLQMVGGGGGFMMGGEGRNRNKPNKPRDKRRERDEDPKSSADELKDLERLAKDDDEDEEEEGKK